MGGLCTRLPGKEPQDYHDALFQCPPAPDQAL